MYYLNSLELIFNLFYYFPFHFKNVIFIFLLSNKNENRQKNVLQGTVGTSIYEIVSNILTKDW